MGRYPGEKAYRSWDYRYLCPECLESYKDEYYDSYATCDYCGTDMVCIEKGDVIEVKSKRPINQA